MAVIPGILRASEDLNKFSETLRHLERCYASNSDSGSAAVAEFFAELSQLEQGETLASIRTKARLAVEDLAVPVALLLQTQEQALIIIDKFKKLKAQVLASELKSNCVGLEDIEELEEAVVSIYKSSILIYTLLSKSVHESWNYFPVELHQLFEKLANHLDCRQEIDPDIAASILVNLKHLDEESEAAVGSFMYSVRKAVEENTLKPKWQLYQLHDSKFQEIEDTIDSAELRRAVEENDGFVTLESIVANHAE